MRKSLYKVVLPALTLKSEAQVFTTQNVFRLNLQRGNLPEAKKCLKALIADVPYSNKKLASMDMEERYRLIMSTIFKADKRKVIALAVELDSEGKGLVDWTEVKE